MGVREWADRLAGGRAPVEKRTEPPSLFDLVTGAWSGGYMPSSYTSVTYDAAKAHSAVYACVDVLVRMVAWQMPASISGRSERLPSIVANPHPEPQLSAKHWRAQALESAVLRGYAAGLVTSREPSGWPRQILPVHPDCVTWYTSPGSRRTEWRVEGSVVDLWQAGGELWLAPSPRVTPGSLVGSSVLSHAAQQIRLGLDARKFGQDFFQAGGLPVAHGKVLDEPNITQEQATALKQRIVQTTRNREPLVTGSNFDLSTIPINAEESQFLETMQANVADVCRFFGIPPEAIGGSSGDSMTYKNLTALRLGMLTDTVGAWMQWLEDVLTSLLPRPQVVDLDPATMLRTDVPTLYQMMAQAVGSSNTPGFVTVNEAREKLGFQPHPDGDALYVPTNYAPADLIEDVVLPDQGMVGDGEPVAAA